MVTPLSSVSAESQACPSSEIDLHSNSSSTTHCSAHKTGRFCPPSKVGRGLPQSQLPAKTAAVREGGRGETGSNSGHVKYYSVMW